MAQTLEVRSVWDHLEWGASWLISKNWELLQSTMVLSSIAYFKITLQFFSFSLFMDVRTYIFQLIAKVAEVVCILIATLTETETETETSGIAEKHLQW